MYNAGRISDYRVIEKKGRKKKRRMNEKTYFNEKTKKEKAKKRGRKGKGEGHGKL